MKSVELLSPAGDFQRLKYAIAYGADAVYVGGSHFTMRTNPQNFDFDSLREAVEFVHSKNKKIYLTCNTLPRNDEIENLPEFLTNSQQLGVDALIVADIGVLCLAKKFAPDTDIHISTQAGIVNYQSARTYFELGAKRVVLARELCLDEIKTIRDKTDPKLEIEVFVHGAMCMSFSGRCILSDYLAGRDANRGQCAQPCRWKYYLMEETRPGEYFPINEEKNGSYIFNSRDLCMIEHIPELVASGIDSFKIEGRAKSEYYTAEVTNAYRAAIDEYYKKNGNKFELPDWILDEIYKISHREYTTGFYLSKMKNGQVLDNGGYVRHWEVCALFDSYDEENERIIVKQRNRFFEGEILEITEPYKKPYSIKVESLYNEDSGEFSQTANIATARYSFKCSRKLGEYAIFRRIVK